MSFKSARAIKTLKESYSLQDIWRVKNPDLQSFTWSQKSLFVFCRLDYWLTLYHLFDYVKNVDIVPAIKTDHSAITIEFQSIDQQLKGSGFWKLNVSPFEKGLCRGNGIQYTYMEK